MPTLDQIKDQILAMFPVGSEWYDCVQDSCGKISHHFKPWGVVMRWTGGSLTVYPYGDLLQGRLIKPRMGGWYHQYRAEKKDIQEQYETWRKENGLDKETLWQG